MLEFQNQSKGLIVRPMFEAPGAEDSNAIPLVINAVDMDGNVVQDEVTLSLRVSAAVTGLESSYGKYQGVIGAAHSGVTIGAHDNEAFGSILSGAGTATVVLRTNAAGYAGVKLSYAGAATCYVGVGPAAFGSTLIVGDQVAQLTFAS